MARSEALLVCFTLTQGILGATVSWATSTTTPRCRHPHPVTGEGLLLLICLIFCATLLRCALRFLSSTFAQLRSSLPTPTLTLGSRARLPESRHHQTVAGLTQEPSEHWDS